MRILQTILPHEVDNICTVWVPGTTFHILNKVLKICIDRSQKAVRLYERMVNKWDYKGFFELDPEVRDMMIAEDIVSTVSVEEIHRILSLQEYERDTSRIPE